MLQKVLAESRITPLVGPMSALGPESVLQGDRRECLILQKTHTPRGIPQWSGFAKRRRSDNTRIPATHGGVWLNYRPMLGCSPTNGRALPFRSAVGIDMTPRTKIA